MIVTSTKRVCEKSEFRVWHPRVSPDAPEFIKIGNGPLPIAPRNLNTVSGSKDALNGILDCPNNARHVLFERPHRQSKNEREFPVCRNEAYLVLGAQSNNKQYSGFIGALTYRVVEVEHISRLIDFQHELEETIDI